MLHFIKSFGVIVVGCEEMKIEKPSRLSGCTVSEVLQLWGAVCNIIHLFSFVFSFTVSRLEISYTVTTEVACLRTIPI